MWKTQVYGDITGQGFGLIQSNVHLLSGGNWKDQLVPAKQQSVFPHSEFQTTTIYKVTALLPHRLQHLTKIKN